MVPLSQGAPFSARETVTLFDNRTIRVCKGKEKSYPLSGPSPQKLVALRVRVRASDDEDDEELIPPTAVEEGAEALPAEQSVVGACGASPLVEALVRDAHSRLADLLQAASSILAEMHSLSSMAKEGVAELSGRGD
ncbi:unnamed protein product [Lampetra fluviatilis]